MCRRLTSWTSTACTCLEKKLFTFIDGIPFYSFQIMSSLPTLERFLGSLYSWPRDILRYPFLVTPTSYTIRQLAAFLYGNDIPRQLALDFFHECSSPTSDQIDSFRSEYDAWDRDFDSSFVYEFYDMTFGCVVHLRGDGVVVERNDPIQIGFGDDIFPPCVMRKIEDMWK